MDNFDLILKVIDSRAEFSPSLLTWLKQAILKKKRGIPMELAFGVSPPRKKAQRDELLRQYACALTVESNTEKAKLILGEVNRLQSGRECSPMVAAAADFKKIPRSLRQLLRILKNDKKS